MLLLSQWTLHGVSLPFVLLCTTLENAQLAYCSSGTINNHHCQLFGPFWTGSRFVSVFRQKLRLLFSVCLSLSPVNSLQSWSIQTTCIPVSNQDPLSFSFSTNKSGLLFRAYFELDSSSTLKSPKSWLIQNQPHSTAYGSDYLSFAQLRCDQL